MKASAKPKNLLEEVTTGLQPNDILIAHKLVHHRNEPFKHGTANGTSNATITKIQVPRPPNGPHYYKCVIHTSLILKYNVSPEERP